AFAVFALLVSACVPPIPVPRPKPWPTTAPTTRARTTTTLRKATTTTTSTSVWSPTSTTIASSTTTSTSTTSTSTTSTTIPAGPPGPRADDTAAMDDLLDASRWELDNYVRYGHFDPSTANAAARFPWVDWGAVDLFVGDAVNV